jgi:uncharacterized protein YdeI (YjbR/CyaY-like superfamily)
MEPTFFPTPASFRKWLEQQHTTEKELLVGFFKIGSGQPSITWPESVDQALCFGWIDGIRRSIDESSYSIRFTPRKPSSIWSAVNIRKMEELTAQGLMTPAGLAAFQKRKEDKSVIYSYEKPPQQWHESYETVFRENEKAWANFHAKEPYYRKTAMYWVMSAKQEATRLSRLQTLIQDSEAGMKIKSLRYNEKKR